MSRRALCVPVCYLSICERQSSRPHIIHPYTVNNNINNNNKKTNSQMHLRKWPSNWIASRHVGWHVACRVDAFKWQSWGSVEYIDYEYCIRPVMCAFNVCVLCCAVWTPWKFQAILKCFILPRVGTQPPFSTHRTEMMKWWWKITHKKMISMTEEIKNRRTNEFGRFFIGGWAKEKEQTVK